MMFTVSFLSAYMRSPQPLWGTHKSLIALYNYVPAQPNFQKQELLAFSKKEALALFHFVIQKCKTINF